MTDEELDLLASSYLDGEATPEEVAMIERDPALRDRVEELRVAQVAMRAPVPQPSMGLKEEQLAAALAAFDLSDRRTTLMAVDGPADQAGQATPPDRVAATEGADPTVEAPDPTETVIDLRARRERQERSDAEAAGRMRWLSAVAGVLVFTAGAVFLVGQVGGGDDAAEFATDAQTADTEATEAAPSSDGSGADAASAAELSADADAADESIESEAMGDTDAEGDFAVEESEEAADDEAADQAESAADSGESAPDIRDFAEEGFFGDEPVVSYETIPTSDELLNQLDLPWREPATANCAAAAGLPDGAAVVGYLPIEIPAADGGDDLGARVVEALYLTVGNEIQVVLVDPDTCATVN